jgi:ring-1,2-phenylacetyl-CoA epoxidase subunit PaaC
METRVRDIPGSELLPDDLRSSLFDYLLRLGDDALILGHRLSEWCGHGPTLEEDIALANISLDHLGRANALLALAGSVEDAGRSEDDLAFSRDERHFVNVQMVELQNGDFAFTMVRQFLLDAFALPFYESLSKSSWSELAGLAAKCVKESKYHLRHSRNWILRMGDGTTESHDRVQRAVDEIWMYTGELFEVDDVSRSLSEHGIAVSPDVAWAAWSDTISATLQRATLSMPILENGHAATGGRRGIHTEHLGHLLSEMQILARSFPGAAW